MKKKIVSLLLPIFLLGAAFTVYWYTKPPAILWVDSGTMIAASYTLGIPNPPGFPLYMMASHLFTRLPFADVLTRLELFSIVFSLMLLFLVYRIILLILENDFFFHHQGKSNKVGEKQILSFKSSSWQADSRQGIQNRASSILPHFAALFGAISLAFSYQYWSQTLNTEAFIFTYFFVTLFIYLLLKVAVKKRSLAYDIFRSFADSPDSQVQQKGAEAEFGRRYGRYFSIMLSLFAFLYGLAAGANPTVTAFIPATIFFLYLNRRYLTEKRIAALLIIFSLTAIAVYLYLPLRAKSYPFVNWGNPQTINLFFGHLRGAGLNIYEPESGSINGFTGSPLVFLQAMGYFFLMAFLQFTPLLVPFIIFGMYLTYKKNKLLFIYLLSVPLTNAFHAGVYHSGNQESWFILSWIVFAIFIGLGYFMVVKSYRLSKKTTFLLFLLAFLPLAMWMNWLNRRNHYYASDYARNLYGHLDKGAILLGTGDFLNSLGNYMHEVDDFRRDVIPVIVNMFYVNKWYRDNLRYSTDLVIDDDIENIIQYRSFAEFNQAMNEFIADNIDKRPIYVSHLALRASALAATSGGQLRLDKRFKFVPHGLSLKVVRASEAASPDLSAYDYSFKVPLNQPPRYLEKNYRGAFKNILNDYVYGWEFLADWYADKGDFDTALAYYKKGQSVDAYNVELLAHLGEFYARQNDFNASYQYLSKAAILDAKNVFIHFNLGLSLANLGRTEAAKKEFETVMQLAPRGDPLIAEAQSILKKLNTIDLSKPEISDEVKNWREWRSRELNMTIRVPPDLTSQEMASPSGVMFTDNQPGQKGITIAAVSHQLAKEESLESYLEQSPLKMEGMIIDTKEISLPNYTGIVQVFANPVSGQTSQRYVIVKGRWVWQFKVYPGDSEKIDLFSQMLNTFRMLSE